MPPTMGQGRLNRVASTIARSWVLSPISARATTKAEVNRASTRYLRVGLPMTSQIPPDRSGGAMSVVSPERSTRSLRATASRPSTLTRRPALRAAGYSPDDGGLIADNVHRRKSALERLGANGQKVTAAFRPPHPSPVGDRLQGLPPGA